MEIQTKKKKHEGSYLPTLLPMDFDSRDLIFSCPVTSVTGCFSPRTTTHLHLQSIRCTSPTRLGFIIFMMLKIVPELLIP